MRRQLRKDEDDEMLVTHKAPEEMALAGREAVEGPAVDRRELDRLRRLLAAAADPAERSRLADAIQRRFGNEAARQAVGEARVESAEPEAAPEPETET